MIGAELLSEKGMLLEQERRLEAQLAEKASNRVATSSVFVAKLQSGFVETCSCSADGIKGCYAPTGVHAQKMLEVGMRYDCVMLSILEQKGEADLEEIENVEASHTRT